MIGLEEGYSETLDGILKESGVTICRAWLRNDWKPNLPGAGWEMFRDIWTAETEKPDGLLICDDILSRDVAVGILDLRISVPDQLTVVTHSNKGAGIVYPFPVVRLEYDPDLFAETMSENLLKMMKKETIPEVTVLPCRLYEDGFNHSSTVGGSSLIGVSRPVVPGDCQ